VWFIGKIRELYRIEYAARALDHTERHALRQVQAPPLWAALQTRAEELRPKLLPQRTMGKAVNYFLNEYKALEGYLRDGHFEIDNNLIENAIRPTAVGRRRWLFIGHPQAGWRSAVIYSLLLSCRRRGINPQSYLSDVLSRLPSTKITEISMSAHTVRAALEDLERSQSDLYRNVCDETGALRRHLNVFVNSDNVRDLNGVDTTLAPGDVVTILPAVSGG